MAVGKRGAQDDVPVVGVADRGELRLVLGRGVREGHAAEGEAVIGGREEALQVGEFHGLGGARRRVEEEARLQAREPILHVTATAREVGAQ